MNRKVSLLVVAALMGACGGNPAPKPPAPSPQIRAVAFTLWRPDGAALADGTVTLATDGGLSVGCSIRTDGGWVCPLAPDVPVEVGATLHVAAPGIRDPELRFAVRSLPAGVGIQGLCESPGTALEECLGNVSLPPLKVDQPWLPRLERAGQFFRAGGPRVTLIGASDFDLLEQFVNGGEPAIANVLQQRAHPWGDARPGFNMLRVWTAFNVCPDGNCPPSNQRIGRVVPRERGDLYDRLREMARVASNYGFYLELTAFTGNFAADFASDGERVAHWEGLIGVALDCPNVILDLQNEWDHQAMAGFNAVPFREPPAPVIASHGSGQADSSPFLPVWRDLATYHPGFGDEWPRKAIHNGMEDVADKYGIAVLLDEMTRFPDGDSDPQHAYDVGRGCALMVAGCVFHTVHGKGSSLWDAVELGLAQRWVDGARSLPLDCQGGGYRHLAERENDAIIRSYIRGGDPACIVDVHR